MTERWEVVDRKLKVSRAAHKDDLDLDLADLAEVSYEREPGFGPGGSAVLRTKSGAEHVVRVDAADAGGFLTALREEPAKAPQKPAK